ncbi:hypothetical protein BHM03_00049414 [Ensete ventricosum]|nr:hypothetical protein BHM03_00049414 [Ensete ventricosum]
MLVQVDNDGHPFADKEKTTLTFSMNIKPNNNTKYSNVRKYLMLTLSNADNNEQRQNVTPGEIINRIKHTLQPESIIVAKERHESGNLHYHVGILKEKGIMRRKANPKEFRSMFPEFNGAQLDIKCFKKWSAICNYIYKEDPDPIVWGQQSIHQQQEMIHAVKKHKVIPSSTYVAIVERLKTLKQWNDVYEDPELAKMAFKNYNSLKAAFEDLNDPKRVKGSLLQRFLDYLKLQGWPDEYSIDELGEKYWLLDWLATNLIFRRPIKTKQLMLYGRPNTQKTLMFEMLSEVLNIYFASSRRNDFTGASDHYDLWVFDEFHLADTKYNLYSKGEVEELATFANNTFLKVLDGQQCKLDTKYGKVINKFRNVPIVVITNVPGRIIREAGPFHERFMRLKFNTKLKKLLGPRVVATLLGCIERRLNQKKTTWETANQIALKYNEEVASIKLRATPRDEETRKLEKLRWSREWGIEADLKEGDRGIIHTEAGTHFPVVVVRKGIFGEYSMNEYIDFTAKIPFVKMYEKTLEQRRAERKDDEQSLTMLEFAFIPLQAQLDLGILHEVHIDNKHVAWKAIHGFRKQNRPFIIGNYNTRKNKSEETQWQKPEEQPAWNALWTQPGDTTLFASWPVQAYCQSFAMSNSIMLTYATEEDIAQKIRLHHADQEPQSEKQSTSKTYSEELQITLKITGGAMKCKSNSSEPDLIEEEWADEDVY